MNNVITTSSLHVNDADQFPAAGTTNKPSVTLDLPRTRGSWKVASMFFGAILSLGTGCIGDATSEEEMDEFDNDEGATVASAVAIGQGYNSITGAGLNTAIEGAISHTGGSSEVTFTIAKSNEELSSALEIDQSLSVEFMGIGVSQKMKFMQSLKTSAFGLSIIVRAKHVQGTATLTNTKFKPGVILPANNTSAANTFFTQYGDSFVTSRRVGGEFIGVYTCEAHSKQEQMNVEAGLAAGGVVSGVTVNASLESKLQQATKSSNSVCTYRALMTGMKNPQFPKPEGMVSFALHFPAMPLTAPEVIQITGAGYETVPGMKNFGRIVANRAYLNGNGLTDGLAAWYLKIAQYKEQADELTKVYNFYGYTGDTVFKNRKNVINSDMEKVYAQALKVKNNPTAELTPKYTAANLVSLQYGAPTINAEFPMSKALGGSGGSKFAHFGPEAFESYLWNRTYISGIEMGTYTVSGIGVVIDKLKITYREAKTGKVYIGDEGAGDIEQSAFVIAQGKFLSKVRVQSGTRVDNLHFYVDPNGPGYGAGGPGGDVWVINQPGNILMSFEGRSGAGLDAIQARFAKFNPAKWSIIP